MTSYIIQTTQEFNVTYRVEAANPGAAWSALLDGEGECVDQQPADINARMADSSIEEDA